MAQAKTWITAYGCTSSAGPGVADYWTALCQGKDQSRALLAAAWPVPVTFEPRACIWPETTDSVSKVLTAQLLQAWKSVEAEALDGGEPLGVIFASTKGAIEDFIWNKTLSPEQPDSLTPVLNYFLRQAGIQPKRSLCISNACASSLSALFLAQRWLAQGEVTQVLVLAADRVGPFVTQGFHSLRALTGQRARPFDRSRDGLMLGEAAAVLLLSAKPGKGESHELEAVGLDAEGFAVTRPSLSGDSLQRACLQLPLLREAPPELIVAHGTGTVLNDQTEAHVFTQLFEAARIKPSITGTKWCIGHTLGASGAMDVIAACRVLETQNVFHLANTHEVDPAFRGNFLAARDSAANFLPSERAVRRVLITSLGFGGVHAAATLRRWEG